MLSSQQLDSSWTVVLQRAMRACSAFFEGSAAEIQSQNAVLQLGTLHGWEPGRAIMWPSFTL